MKIFFALTLAACASASPPTIASFTATPLVASDGDTVHLAFAASGSAAINGDKVSGSTLDVQVSADPIAGDIARAFTLTVTSDKSTATQTLVVHVLRVPAAPVITAPAHLVAPQDAIAIVQPEDGVTYGWQVSGADAIAGADSAALSFHVSAPGAVQLTCIAETALGRTATGAPVTLTTQGATVFAGAPGVAGNADGPGASARFGSLTALQRATDGTIYGIDAQAHAIKKVSAVGNDWQVTTLAGHGSGCVDGTGIAASFDEPRDLWLDAANQRLLIAEGSSIGRVRAVSLDGVVTTLIAGGSGPDPVTCTAATHVAGMAGLIALTVAPGGDIWGEDTAGSLFDLPTATPAATLPASDTATLRFVGATLFVLDGTAGCIRRAPSFDCWVGGTTVASIDGAGTSAGFTQPLGMAVSAQGFLIGDSGPVSGGLVRVVDMNGNVATLAGSVSAERTTALTLPLGALPSTVTGVVDAAGTTVLSGDDALLRL